MNGKECLPVMKSMALVRAKNEKRPDIDDTNQQK